MSHRVHTILSILAEDHAPSALRPSILLAIDWPTVTEEAPATGDDAHVAGYAARIIKGDAGLPLQQSPTIAALAPLAARLATVAASLATTGDKAMAAHAAALWGAAAALVGFRVASLDATANVNPSTAEVYLRALAHKANGLMFGMSRTPAEQAAIVGTVLDKVKAHEFSDHEELRASHERLKDALASLATKAADIVPGVIAAGPAEKATLIATALDRVTHWRHMVQTRDTALGDLGWNGAENLQASMSCEATPKLDRTRAICPLVVWTARHKAEHDKALSDAIAKDGFRAEMHAAIGREMEMRKQVVAMQDQCARVRAIFDDALGTTKGATTFTLADIAEEMALQRAKFKQECDAANDNKFVHDILKACADEAAKHTGETVTIYAAEQAGVIGAALRKLVAERDAAEEAWRKAMREWTTSESTRPR